MNALLTLAQEPGSVQSLPAVAHILAATALAIGLVFWIFGRKLLKPAFGLLGALIGAIAGLLILSSVVESVLGFPSPYLGIIIGGAVGLVLGITLFRFAVAITTALALGLAGSLLAAAYIHFAPPTTATAPIETPTLKFSTPALDAAAKAHEVIEAARPMAQQVTDFVSQRVSDIHAAWKELPGYQQFVLGASGLGGAVIGFLLGMLFPVRSSAIATALFGSALWMVCAVWLLDAINAPGHDLRHPKAVIWLPVWIGLAVVGFAIQVSGTGKRKKKPEAE